MISRYAQSLGFTPMQSIPAGNALIDFGKQNPLPADHFVRESVTQPYFAAKLPARYQVAAGGAAGLAIMIVANGSDGTPRLPDGTVSVAVTDKNNYVGGETVSEILEVPVLMDGKPTELTFVFTTPVSDEQAAKAIAAVVDQESQQLRSVSGLVLNPRHSIVVGTVLKAGDTPVIGLTSKSNLHGKTEHG